MHLASRRGCSEMEGSGSPCNNLDRGRFGIPPLHGAIDLVCQVSHGWGETEGYAVGRPEGLPVSPAWRRARETSL